MDVGRGVCLPIHPQAIGPHRLAAAGQAFCVVGVCVCFFWIRLPTALHQGAQRAAQIPCGRGRGYSLHLGRSLAAGAQQLEERRPRHRGGSGSRHGHAHPRAQGTGGERRGLADSTTNTFEEVKMSLNPALQQKIEAAKEVLSGIERDFSPATFANSFGAEDMVLTDLICKHAPNIEIFTLDTGRLPAETYNLMQESVAHYGNRFVPYFPKHDTVEGYVREHGPNAFYESVDLRKQCCHIRKVEPLQRALKGKKAWIAGLRREQAPTCLVFGVLVC